MEFLDTAYLFQSFLPRLRADDLLDSWQFRELLASILSIVNFRLTLPLHTYVLDLKPRPMKQSIRQISCVFLKKALLCGQNLLRAPPPWPRPLLRARLFL